MYFLSNFFSSIKFNEGSDRINARLDKIIIARAKRVLCWKLVQNLKNDPARPGQTPNRNMICDLNLTKIDKNGPFWPHDIVVVLKFKHQRVMNSKLMLSEKYTQPGHSPNRKMICDLSFTKIGFFGHFRLRSSIELKFKEQVVAASNLAVSSLKPNLKHE